MGNLEKPVPGKNSLLYCPTPKQFAFHAGRGVYYERATLCGGGAGKTICGLAEDVRWAIDFPGSVGVITEPSYPMVRINLIPALESKWLLGCPFPFHGHPYIADFSLRDLRLDWRNGSQWWFRSWDNPESLEGANIDYIHLDEPRLILHLDTALLTAKRRLRGSGRCKVPVTPGLWLTTTPDKPMTVLFNELENPKTRNPDSKIYRWSIYDNPFLPKGFIDAMVQSHTGGLAERFIFGRFANVGTGSFPFDSALHVRSIERQLLKEIRYGVDFGWTNPTAILALGFDSDDRAYAIDEVYKSQMAKEEILTSLLEFKKTIGPGQVFCDPSGPETIEYLRRGGLTVQGNIFKREDGIRELGSRFLKASDGQPRLFVSPKCVNLISELLEYREDVKERDHAVDALRYAMKLKAKPDVGAFRFGR